MRRYEKERKAEEIEDKDNEIIAFIDVLVDLFLCKQYRDCVNKKNIDHSSRAPQIHIKEIFVL